MARKKKSEPEEHPRDAWDEYLEWSRKRLKEAEDAVRAAGRDPDAIVREDGEGNILDGRPIQFGPR